MPPVASRRPIARRADSRTWPLPEPTRCMWSPTMPISTTQQISTTFYGKAQRSGSPVAGKRFHFRAGAGALPGPWDACRPWPGRRRRSRERRLYQFPGIVTNPQAAPNQAPAPPSLPSGATASVVRLQSRTLFYAENEHKAVFSGGVVAQTSSGLLRSSFMDVYFTPPAGATRRPGQSRPAKRHRAAKSPKSLPGAPSNWSSPAARVQARSSLTPRRTAILCSPEPAPRLRASPTRCAEQ